jgi:hypothetical protein
MEFQMAGVINHCAICGREIEPEEQFCADCASQKLEPCPECGKLICECEAGPGD